MNARRFSLDVAATLLLQGLTQLFVLIRLAILGRALGAAGKGTVELALLVPTFLALLLGGGVNVANVYFAGRARFDVKALTANSVTLTLIATALSLALTLILGLAGALERLLPGIPQWLLALALLSFPLELLAAYLMSILQGQRRIAAANFSGLVKSAVALFLTVVLVIVVSGREAGALAAMIVAALAHIVVAWRLLRDYGAILRPRWQRGILRESLHYGLRAHLANLTQFFNYRLDAFILNAFLGPAGVGVYNVAVRFAEMLWFLPQAVGYVILPTAAATHPEHLDRVTPRVFKATLALTIGGALLLALAGRPLITLFYGTSFLEAYRPLLWLLPGVTLLGGAKVLTNEIAGRGFPQYNAVTSGVALLATIALDLWLIPRLGITGAAIASTVAYALGFLGAVASYGLVRRATPLPGQREVLENVAL